MVTIPTFVRAARAISAASLVLVALAVPTELPLGFGGTSARAAGDLSRQTPVEVTVELGTKDGQLRFSPDKLEFETGKLYKLILTNTGARGHYFTAPAFAPRIFTRKAQVMSGGKALAEVYGGITRVEVAAGGTAEWWFVPVATGQIDFYCDGKVDGVSNKDKGMVGTIVIK